MVGEKGLVPTGVGTIAIPKIAVRVEARMNSFVGKALRDPIAEVEFDVRTANRQPVAVHGAEGTTAHGTAVDCQGACNVGISSYCNVVG